MVTYSCLGGGGVSTIEEHDKIQRSRCVVTLVNNGRTEPMDTSRHWVGTWSASPAPSEAGVGFNNHTLRMNPRVSIGGDTLRVRISNAYGSGRLEIGAAFIGLRDKGPAIVPGSERPLTFCGSASATVAAGALLVSDSVRLDVKPLADLA